MLQNKQKVENIKNNLNELLSELINENTISQSSQDIQNDKFKNPHRWIDIIDFCESPYYLGLNLYPWQKLILKLFYMGSEGNQHLKINENTEGCKNCVWDRNKLRIHNPCLKCSNMPIIDIEKNIAEIQEKMWATDEEMKELRETERTNLFMNEMQLIQRDLLDESDSINGGSVKQQVLDKIGKNFSELLLVIGRRSGKMLDLNTPIITPEGWKTMKDIHVGDYVFGPDGYPTRVIAESEIENNPDSYEMTFSNGEKIKCHSEHEWNIFDQNRLKSWIYYKDKNNIQDIFPKNWQDWEPNLGGTNHYSGFENDLILQMKSIGISNNNIGQKLNRTESAIEQQYTKIRKNIKKETNKYIYTTKEIYDMVVKNNEKVIIPISEPLHFNHTQKLPIDPWVLGYLCGDGDTSGSGRIACDSRDREHCLKKFSSVGYKENTNDKYDDIHFNVKGLTKEWKKLNLHNGKYIPEIYKISSINDRISLLTGLIDSDGHIDSHGIYRFTNTNKRLIDDVKEICHSLGLDVSLYYRENRERNGHICKPSYELAIRSFIPLTTIIRKLEKAKHNWKYEQKSNIITNVEKCDPVPMKCIQVDNCSNQYLCGKTMIPTHNSLMVSIIALYESYKVIEMKNPQAIFGNLNEGDTICILNVAVSEQQAKESIFDKIKPMIMNSPYFKSKISPGTIQNRSVRFLTQRDEEINQQLINEGLPARDGSIYLLSGHSNSDSLVGKNVLVVIIDEMASMVGKDGSKMSDEELYTKLKHSIWTFGQRGKILCISNPLTKDGKFYELYEQSFSDPRILMVQLPSYKVNPTLDQKALGAEREAAQQAGQYEQYLMQIEARFSGGAADPFIPSEFIDMAFEKGSHRRRGEVGDPNILYYMHLDPANNSDNYALAIVHVEYDMNNLDANRQPQKIIIVDHIHMWCPSETGEPVNISDVDNYVIDKTNHFNIVSITYDMWESAASSQLLQRMGKPARITPFSGVYKQQIYSTLRNIFFEGRIEFYMLDSYNQEKMMENYGFVSEAMDQFKFLSKKFNPKSFSVHATAGHNDDIPDCVAGASFIALTGQHGYTTLPQSRSVRMATFR